MSDHTGIEWTDATWNPIRGCSRVSEGCRNCYAESVAARFSGPGMPYEGLATRKLKVISNDEQEVVSRWTGVVRVIEDHMLDPIRWRKPRRIFVNSMSDLFHENVTDETIDRVFAVMSLAPRHTYQVLTKRPARMAAYLSGSAARDRVCSLVNRPDIWGRPVGDFQINPPHWPLPYVWLGVSAEHQAAADERIPLLLQTPAAVRFLSCEPLLGPVNLGLTLLPRAGHVRRLDWVIAGGESGHGARPMHPGWARSLRDQCVGAGVPFFFKQWGAHTVVPTDPESPRLPQKARWLNLAGGHGFHGEQVVAVLPVPKKLAGRDLDGRTWDEFPAVTL